METVRQNKNRRRNRDMSIGHAIGGFAMARSICKAPRLDNEQLMELHNEKDVLSLGGVSKNRNSEFLDLWLDQLEETSRAMPHEKLLQRVLELENELLETQDKLKKANRALFTKKNTSSNKSPGADSPLYSSPRYTPHASPLYTPIYQSPRYLLSPNTE